MNKRSLFLLCGAILLLFVFILAALLFEQSLVKKEQSLQATATVYIPTTLPPPTTEATEPTVVTAPDFVIAGQDGGTYGILNFKGKPTIVCFWNKEAKAELDMMQELYELYGENANFVMVHITTQEEPKERAASFVRQQRYTFPVYFDTFGSAAAAYKVTQSPTTYFIDEFNVPQARAQGPLDPAALPKALDSIGLKSTTP